MDWRGGGWQESLRLVMVKEGDEYVKAGAWWCRMRCGDVVRVGCQIC